VGAPRRSVAISSPTMSKPLMDMGVVLKDRKKWFKKSSPVVLMWQLHCTDQWLPAIKMSEQALKKSQECSGVDLLSASAVPRRVGEYAKALEKAEQAVEEDRNLAYAWHILRMSQRTVYRWRSRLRFPRRRSRWACTPGTRRQAAVREGGTSRRCRKRSRRRRRIPATGMRGSTLAPRATT